MMSFLAEDVIALVKVIPDISSVNAAESRVNIAKIEQQKLLYERNKNLFDKKVILQEEFEQSNAASLILE